MKEYYIYAYLRPDGTPYYIGKGSDKRAWCAGHRIKLPKDPSCIVIMERGLTNIGALALERFYIRWYGRKDNGTGILRNLTDGGDGIAGAVLSEEHKTKLAIAATGRVHTPETREKIRKLHYNKIVSSETRARMSAAKGGITPEKFLCIISTRREYNKRNACYVFPELKPYFPAKEKKPWKSRLLKES